MIVFAPANAGALQSVSANGGDPKAGDDARCGAQAKPAIASRGSCPTADISCSPRCRRRTSKFDLFVGSLDSPARAGRRIVGERRRLRRTRLSAVRAQERRWSPSAFDARHVASLRRAGRDRRCAELDRASYYAASRAVTVSATGTLAYLGDRLPDTNLVWFDRSGRTLGSVAVPAGRYQEIAFAPDGRRAAIVRAATQSESDIWIADLERGGATRFTFGPAANLLAVWSPDSSRVVFASDRNGPRDLYIKPSSGATPEEVLFKSEMLFKDPRTWSSDGRFIVLDMNDPKTNRDIFVLPVASAGDSTLKPYLRTPFQEVNGTLSPDQKWMAVRVR